jgi:putative membrane protein
MMGWYDGGWNGSGWLVMSLMMVFWVGVVAFAVWAFFRLTRGGERTFATPVESPRSVLDRRFAAGEIDSEQYAQTRRILDGQSVQATSASPR